MRHILIVMFVALAIVTATTAAGKTIKPHHKNADLECCDCHGPGAVSSYQPVETKGCLSCHGSMEDVAALTKHLDAEEVNPHNSYHYGPKLDCFVCHSEHKQSESLCNFCHDASTWMKPAP